MNNNNVFLLESYTAPREFIKKEILKRTEKIENNLKINKKTKIKIGKNEIIIDNYNTAIYKSLYPDSKDPYIKLEIWNEKKERRYCLLNSKISVLIDQAIVVININNENKNELCFEFEEV